MKPILVLLTTLLLLTGCQSVADAVTYASPEVAKSGNYGPKPSAEECRQIVQSYIRETFKDPYSVRDLEIAPAEPYSRFRGIQNGGGYFFAWLVSFRCNAKNSYGGYGGLQTFTIVVRDGRLIGLPDEPVWNYFRRLPPGTPSSNH